MAFGREAAVTAVKIMDITTSLFDPDPTGTETQKATVAVQVKMSNGDLLTRHFNLVDHVSGATITQLQALAATLRAKANAEILPAP